MADRPLHEILDVADIDPKVLAVLPDDAPEGHEAWTKVKLNTTHASPLCRVTIKGVSFQTTVGASGSGYTCMRLMRHLYMKHVDEGMDREKVLALRDEVYQKIAAVGGGAIAKPKDRSKEAKPKEPKAPTKTKSETSALSAPKKASGALGSAASSEIILQKVNQTLTWVGIDLAPNVIKLKSLNDNHYNIRVQSNAVDKFTVTPKVGVMTPGGVLEFKIAVKSQEVDPNAKVAFMLKAYRTKPGVQLGADEYDKFPDADVQGQKLVRVITEVTPSKPSGSSSAAQKEKTAEGDSKTAKTEKNGKADASKTNGVEKKDKKQGKDKNKKKHKDGGMDAKVKAQRPGDSSPHELYFDKESSTWRVVGGESASATSAVVAQCKGEASQLPVADGVKWSGAKAEDEELKMRCMRLAAAGNVSAVLEDLVHEVDGAPPAKKRKVEEKKEKVEAKADAKEEDDEGSSDSSSTSSSSSSDSSSSNEALNIKYPANARISNFGIVACKWRVKAGLRCACCYVLSHECPNGKS